MTVGLSDVLNLENIAYPGGRSNIICLCHDWSCDTLTPTYHFHFRIYVSLLVCVCTFVTSTEAKERSFVSCLEIVIVSVYYRTNS